MFRYCQNMETAQHVLKNVGENHSVIQSCQRDLGHQLPLSSYLLKPVQRLTKYQLILKQLTECSPGITRLDYTLSRNSVPSWILLIKSFM